MDGDRDRSELMQRRRIKWTAIAAFGIGCLVLALVVHRLHLRGRSEHLWRLRRKIGNGPDGSPYIVNVRGRGYKFARDI